MAALNTAPMIPPPTHGSGNTSKVSEWAAGEVWEQDTGVIWEPGNGEV